MKQLRRCILFFPKDVDSHSALGLARVLQGAGDSHASPIVEAEVSRLWRRALWCALGACAPRAGRSTAGSGIAKIGCSGRVRAAGEH